VGYDNNNLYIATDQFCGPLENTYEGALFIAISKSQLLIPAHLSQSSRESDQE